MASRWVAGFWCVLAGGMALAPCARADESAALIQLLIKKGVITQQELEGARGELSQKPSTGELVVADKSAIHVGQGTLKVGGLVQGWALWDGNDNDRFRIRRTELKFAGDVLGDERFKYTVMIDPVQVQEDNTRRTVLQDAFFTLDKFDWLPHHKIDLGQYKLPLTEEGLRSSAKLDFAERSFIGRTFGDQRDVGAMLTGEWPAVTYQAGVFNGSGQNQSDANDGKDLAGRVVLRPFKAWELVGEAPDLGQLEVGMAGYFRHDRGNTREKKRLGYELRYDYKRLSLKSEYAFGQGTAGSNATTENSTLANGWYAQAGYMLLPEKLQTVARVDHFDPNEEVANDRETDFSLGLNYFIAKYHAKAQLNWVRKDEQGDEITNDQVIGAFQYAF